MNLVAILKPNNQLITGNYQIIRNECIKECLKEENIEEFLNFSKNYNYFEPYFDFVIFKLKYIFVNPFYQKKMALCAVENSIYKVEIDNLDYESIKKEAKLKRERNNSIPFMSKCSNEELRIEKKDTANMTTCLLDPNKIGFLNKEGGKNGSHGITGNTILNQLLLISHNIEVDFKNNLTDYDDNTILNYLIINIGFLRITDKEIYSLIIGNTDSLNQDILKLISLLEAEDYQYYNLEVEVKEKSKEYQKVFLNSKQ